MKIKLSNSAILDLEAIKKYYSDEGVPEIGNKFVTDIIRHIETLPDNPDIGRMVPEFNSVKIRELIHNPFRIVYLREDKSLHVIRIWRSERLLKLENTPAEDEL